MLWRLLCLIGLHRWWADSDGTHVCMDCGRAERDSEYQDYMTRMIDRRN